MPFSRFYKLIHTQIRTCAHTLTEACNNCIDILEEILNFQKARHGTFRVTLSLRTLIFDELSNLVHKNEMFARAKNISVAYVNLLGDSQDDLLYINTDVRKLEIVARNLVANAGRINESNEMNEMLFCLYMHIQAIPYYIES